jgi:TPR repeat protein
MKQLALIVTLLSIVLLCIGCTDNSAETTALAEATIPAEVTPLNVNEATILAESGNAMAQFRLGNIYAEGAEVPQDFTEATRWFSKAAEQGYAEAQYNLGVIYSRGFAAPPNYVEGYIWFCLAAKSGFEAATEDCEALVKELSSEELVAAKIREAELSEAIQQRKTVDS